MTIVGATATSAAGRALWQKSFHRGFWRAVLLAVYVTSWELLLTALDKYPAAFNDYWWLFFLGSSTAVVIGFTGFWRRWLFMPEPSASRSSILISAAGALLTLTIFFSVLTSVLAVKGVIPEKPQGRLFAHIEERYCWEFLDQVPAIKIPETLHWKPQYSPKDHLSGALILIYKLLVILPVVGVIKYVWDRRQATSGGSQPDPGSPPAT
jgi:hypothetical protein